MGKYDNKKRPRIFVPFSLAVSIASFLGSCEDTTEMQQQSTSSIEVQQDTCTLNYKAIFSNNHTMSWEEAATLSEDVASLHFGDTSEDQVLRSGRRRIVNDGRVIGKNTNTLRSSSEFNNLPDTLAYVCNFADSSGFAIICADDRVGCPILACADSGTLGDTIDNPGIAIFLENAQIFMENSILKFESEKDSLREKAIKTIVGNLKPANVSLRRVFTGNYTLLKSKEEVKPLLKTVWAQSGSPYNTLIPLVCKYNDGEHAPVGCWAVAIGQIMGYYKHPTSFMDNLRRNNSYGRIELNWEEIQKVKNAKELSEIKYRTQVSKLLGYIGYKIGMEYTCDGSSTNKDNAMSFLKECGYSGTSGKNYNFTSVASQLKSKKPVIMTGKQNRTNRFLGLVYTYSDGHAWVVDGYSFDEATEEHQYQIDTNDESAGKDVLLSVSYKHPLLHMNWGWGGLCNGYFASGCFHITQAESFDYTDNNPSKDADYKYSHTIFPIFR